MLKRFLNVIALPHENDLPRNVKEIVTYLLIYLFIYLFIYLIFSR